MELFQFLLEIYLRNLNLSMITVQKNVRLNQGSFRQTVTMHIQNCGVILMAKEELMENLLIAQSSFSGEKFLE